VHGLYSTRSAYVQWLAVVNTVINLLTKSHAVKAYPVLN
jgi:hypothetical protein